jgi:hypothetical protein
MSVHRFGSWLLLAALLSGCGGARAQATARSPVPVVQVPVARGNSDVASAPPSAVRIERKDPLDYFVGVWDGVFTDERVPHGSWNTVLTIDGYGRFNVHFASPQGPPCDQSGSLRLLPQVVVLDTNHNTCNPDRRGPEERPIISQEDDEYVLRTPDAMMTFRYTRRSAATDEE